ncbi:hypothetical protein M0R89_16405 [Halorussus limi]|uniref:DUF7965 domain-containing protein n=1 Tax=Halorussus limi TaxID=2938695 RepID=A0A8U0HT95_9EURY|nr:hypothetical protein [Halorussus limi]UPV74108.1 hypothetical protein M0R89_16405 [Halorussus limi]
MAEESPPSLALHRVADDPLVVWTLASFHTAALTAVLVAALYLSGALGDLLAGLDTVVGLGLYLGLWASTWWTTRRAFAAIAAAGDDASLSVVLGTGGKWAGVDGVLFLWILVAVVVFPVGSVEGPEAVLSFIAVVGVGSLLAFVVGTVVGLLFAALDLAAFRVAGGLAPGSRERDPPSDGAA